MNSFVAKVLAFALAALIPASSFAGPQLASVAQFTRAPFPFVNPVMDPRKSSSFGMRVHPIRGFSTQHKGVDLAAPVGSLIRSVAAGKVVFADPYAGYGKLIVVEHANGITTHYAHCDKLMTNPGKSVTAGEILGQVGSTGQSTGPHLHFEVRVKGIPQDPEHFFPGLGAEAEG